MTAKNCDDIWAQGTYRMARFQFSLRQLLVAVVVVALALLLLRFAIQSHGVAVALLVVAIAIGILLLANAAIYAFLRAVGMVFGLESHGSDELQLPGIPVPAEGGSRSEL